MKTKLLLLSITAFLSIDLYAQQTIIHYLSGTDKDHTVPWDFMVTHGMNAGKWSKIPVPSCWEQQGFGTFNYGTDRINPEEKGFYKLNFKADKNWSNKKIFLVFEGSMTDTEVKIDSKSAGPIHQGAFYQFRYDITDLLKESDDHLLEVTVSKKSSDNSVNRAERQSDYWLFGGIFRPVFLEIVPATFIERVAVDAKANGNFGMEVFTHNTKPNQTIEIQIQELNGKAVGKPFSVRGADSVFLKNSFAGIRTWNQEQPNLYQAVISIKEGTKTIHTIKQRFGFRTVEFREQDGFYVNDVKVIFKGVNRHSHWPESGRTLSREVHLRDIALMKEMNMNAVRMSHYPPDREFLDLCDSLGLFVLDELAGWQKSYDTAIAGKLVKEMVIRDVNHPSIIVWDNGNEGGWNREVDKDFHLYDPQKRFVMHPWEKFNGTETKHYPDFNYITNAVLYGREVFYPTEFMHGLHDGGHGAALEDFWNEMKKHRGFAGGFLWSLSDEGVVRTDSNGKIDIQGNLAPDGIVGPHREKEGSFYTIKEIWSPVFIDVTSLPKNFNGRIPVENRYLYTNLNECRFEWKMVSLPGPNDNSTHSAILQKGITAAPSLSPGEKGFISIALPKNILADVFHLTALDKKGDTICHWSWPLKTPDEKLAITSKKVSGASAKTNNGSLVVSCDGINYHFDTATGHLQKVVNGRKEISLSDGPRLAGNNLTLRKFRHGSENEKQIIEAVYGDNTFLVQWTFESGQLPKLEYRYSHRGSADFLGITFNYREEKITGMKWMGRGPYRVWKNRLKGQQFGVWEKAYNNTVTGESWNYPEFKGWHSEMYWMKLENRESDFIVCTDKTDIFLQMLKPEKPQGARNENTHPAFPEGNIGFMHAISAIGTKFQAPELLGPQSQKNMQMNYSPITGCLYFDFR